MCLVRSVVLGLCIRVCMYVWLYVAMYVVRSFFMYASMSLSLYLRSYVCRCFSYFFIGVCIDFVSEFVSYVCHVFISYVRSLFVFSELVRSVVLSLLR